MIDFITVLERIVQFRQSIIYFYLCQKSQRELIRVIVKGSRNIRTLKIRYKTWTDLDGGKYDEVQTRMREVEINQKYSQQTFFILHPLFLPHVSINQDSLRIKRKQRRNKKQNPVSIKSVRIDGKNLNEGRNHMSVRRGVFSTFTRN